MTDKANTEISLPAWKTAGETLVKYDGKLDR